jgi:branched-chain amino acid transport system ATP-binding protein
MTPLLEVTGLSAGYGAVEAIREVSLAVPEGATVALIGANGAGKSTTLNTISGLVTPTRGSIRFDGREIVGLRADRIVAAGIVQAPEGRQVFAPLTVEENLQLGACQRRDAGVSADLAAVYDQFPRLAERRRQRAGLLSGGEQQMLAIGRALMARPRLLMLDEPSLGLAPIVVREVFRILEALRAGGRTILLVEQNARQALRMADYAYVLEDGRIAQHGSANELAADRRILDAYLGRASATSR